VTLARPEVRNAFNAELIAELAWTFQAFAEEPPERLRAVVLAGEEGLLRRSRHRGSAPRSASGWRTRPTPRLQEMLMRSTMSVPVIAAVHGAALGGGMALCRVADITVATADTTFGFTETKLGLMPAVISPFVLPRIGEGAARALCDGRAIRLGKGAADRPRVGGGADRPSLDARVDAVLAEVVSAGPEAVRNARR
jgi:methylglutaconyl-CoA hydratase